MLTFLVLHNIWCLCVRAFRASPEESMFLSPPLVAPTSGFLRRKEPKEAADDQTRGFAPNPFFGICVFGRLVHRRKRVCSFLRFCGERNRKRQPRRASALLDYPTRGVAPRPHRGFAPNPFIIKRDGGQYVFPLLPIYLSG